MISTADSSPRLTAADFLDRPVCHGRKQYGQPLAEPSSLRKFLESCRAPAAVPLALQAKVAAAIAEYGHDHAAVRAAKGELPWITPAFVSYDGRRGQFCEHTPTADLFIDVDGLPDRKTAEERRDWYVANHPAVLAGKVSSSGQGVHLFVAVAEPPGGKWKNNKQHHAAVAFVMKALDLPEPADAKAKNFTRLCYWSEDRSARQKADDAVVVPISWQEPAAPEGKTAAGKAAGRRGEGGGSKVCYVDPAGQEAEVRAAFEFLTGPLYPGQKGVGVDGAGAYNDWWVTLCAAMDFGLSEGALAAFAQGNGRGAEPHRSGDRQGKYASAEVKTREQAAATIVGIALRYGWPRPAGGRVALPQPPAVRTREELAAEFPEEPGRAAYEFELNELQRRCFDARDLIPAGDTEHFARHADHAWQAVRAVNDLQPERPLLGRRSGRPVAAVLGPEGRLELQPQTPALLKIPMSQAAFWSSYATAQRIAEGPAAETPLTDADYGRWAAKLQETPGQPKGYARIVTEQGRQRLKLFYPRPHHPNPGVIAAAAEFAPHYIPPLEAVHRHPVLTAGGLLETKGYHRELGAWLDLPELPVMTGAEGLELLTRHFLDLPFEDRAVDWPNYLAYLLSPMLSFYAQGAPMCILTKSQHQVGVSLAQDCQGIIMNGGEEVEVATPRSGRGAVEELDKVIGSFYDKGSALPRLDNVDFMIRSANLAAGLTSRRPTIRLLGSNRTVTPDTWHVTWSATGQTICLSPELMLRSFAVRMNPRHPNPENLRGPATGPRKGRRWQFASLKAATRARHGELLGALTAMVRDWWAAGAAGGSRTAAVNLPPALSNYALWKETVGGILAHYSVSGFLANAVEVVKKASPEDRAAKGLIEDWFHAYKERPVVLSDLGTLVHLYDEEFPPAIPLNYRSESKVAKGRAFSQFLAKRCLDRLHWARNGSGEEILLHCGTVEGTPGGNAVLYKLTREAAYIPDFPDIEVGTSRAGR